MLEMVEMLKLVLSFLLGALLFYAGMLYGKFVACIPKLMEIQNTILKYEELNMSTEILNQKYAVAIEDAEEAKKYYYQENSQ